LEAYVASPVLSQPEKSHLHVLIEILPIDLLKNYVSVVHGLEQVNEPVDVRMVEHFQNISFPPQLIELNILHFLLPYNLDSYLCPVIYRRAASNLSKLSFTLNSFNPVDILDVPLLNPAFQPQSPFGLVWLCFEIKSKGFHI